MNGVRKGADTPDLSGFSAERAELAAVLDSRTFSRTPTLSRFLSYVCERHLEGQGAQIKEYNIAVEGLGRPADFNPEKDSVVRVEAYRLRKRLRRYYQSEGADRPLEIVIPPGHYYPAFVPRQAMNGAGAGPQAGSEDDRLETDTAPPFRRSAGEHDGGSAGLVRTASPPFPSQQSRPRSRLRILVAAGGTVLVGLVLAQVFGMLHDGIEQPPGAGVEQFPVLSLLPVAETAATRIMAGSWEYPYADTEGRTWVGDRFFSGGKELTIAGERMQGGWDDQLFRTHREGNFRYDIPLEPGSYELSLYFSERIFGPGNPAGRGEVSRLFNVLLNGGTLLKEFDIIADAGGPNTAAIRVFRDITPAADGFVHLEFQSVKSQAALSAIELKPMIGGKTAPIRILAGRSAYVYGADGRTWGPDRYFDGGQTVARQNAVSGGADPNLYTAERYGNFTYTLPVAHGTYKLTLGFAETWWGRTNPGGSAEGARVFNVYCNGAALLENFDILREAGGENRTIEKVFHGITPNAQGKIVLSFVPVENYACLNFLELEDETPAQYITKATPRD